MRKMIDFFYTSTRIATLYGLILCLIVLLVPARYVFADANKLYIAPASSQINIGLPFSVNVRSYADSDASPGIANGTVTFPANLLQVTGISTSGTQYNTPSIGQGSGTIGFSATRGSASNPAPSGSAQIFTINFKAIGVGTALVNFSGDSRVNNATTSYVAGVYTIINPNPPVTSTPVPATPKPSTVVIAPVPITATPATPTETPAATTDEPVATPDPTGLISEVVVSPSYATSSVTWKVNATSPASTFTYGTSSSQLDQKADVVKNPDGTFSTKITNLTPGNRYYFVISGSGDGGKAGNYSDTITTIGFPVTMTITENNVAANNAQININHRTYQSASNGKRTIGFAVGNYTVKVTTDTSSQTFNLTVAEKAIPADGSAPESQNVSYNLTSSPLDQAPGSETSIFAFIGILLGGTVVLGLGFVGFMAYRRRRFESSPVSHSSAGSTVVIDDGYDWRSRISPNTTTNTDDLPESAPITQTHNNSVHIADDEPLDMFEQAKKNNSQYPQ